MNKPVFSVLTWNLNGYDKFRDLDESIVNKDAEYVYITNDRSITSNIWTVKYIDIEGDVWENCCKIRYNPFNYVNSDIVIKIDASIKINSDLTPFINLLNEKQYDCGLLVNVTQSTCIEDYLAWVNLGRYTYEDASKCINFLTKEMYDAFKYKGLYGNGFVIQRNDKFNNDWNRITYSILKYLSKDENTCERFDDPIFSFVLNKYFNDKKILTIDWMILDSDILTWFGHGNDFKVPIKRNHVGYLFNKPCDLYTIIKK